MTDTAPTLKPGDTLWFVPHNQYRGDPGEVTIAKVGTKWATITNDRGAMRINKLTLKAGGNGFPSLGRCYRDWADYEAQTAADRAWSRLCRFVYYRDRPPEVTEQKIRQAAALLGVGIDAV